MLSDFVAHAVARVLGRQGETIDPHQPLNEMGLNSLLAVELRNRLGHSVGHCAAACQRRLCSIVPL